MPFKFISEMPNGTGNVGIGTTVPAAVLQTYQAGGVRSKWNSIFSRTNSALISPAVYDSVLIQSDDVPALKL